MATQFVPSPWHFLVQVVLGINGIDQFLRLALLLQHLLRLRSRIRLVGLLQRSAPPLDRSSISRQISLLRPAPREPGPQLRRHHLYRWFGRSIGAAPPSDPQRLHLILNALHVRLTQTQRFLQLLLLPPRANLVRLVQLPLQLVQPPLRCGDTVLPCSLRPLGERPARFVLSNQILLFLYPPTQRIATQLVRRLASLV